MDKDKDKKTLRMAVHLYRTLNPASRAIGQFRLSLNTPKRKQRECIFCGYCTDTWAAEYVRTKRTILQEAKHRASDCAQTYLHARLHEMSEYLIKASSLSIKVEELAPRLGDLLDAGSRFTLQQQASKKRENAGG